MAKKDFECQVHTWMMKKAKKAMVYKAKKERRKGGPKRKGKIRSLGHVRRDLLLNSTLISLTFLH